MNSFIYKKIQKNIGFYLILILSVIVFLSFGDPIVQDKKLSPREYILMEERLMDHQDSIPQVVVKIGRINSVDVAYVTPTEAFPSQKGTWAFKYIPKLDDFVSGGRVMLEFPFAFLPTLKSWTYPQINNSSRAGFVRVGSSNPSTIIALSKRNMLPFNYNIRATFTGVPPIVGDTITFTYGDTSGSHLARATSNVHATKYEFRLLVDKNGNNLWNVIQPIPVIEVVSKPAKQYQITLPSLNTSDDLVSAVIIALDEYNNIDTGFSGTLDLSCSGDTDCGIPNSVEFNLIDSGRVVISFNSGEGEHQIIAINSSGTEFFSNPYMVSTTAPEYRLFWGDIQNHTNISDGNGTIEDFYNYAKNVANLDFIALTDHDHTYGKNYLTFDVWEKIKEFARMHSDGGNFVAFLGWEWTNENKGHKHIIYPGDDGDPRNYRSYPLPSDLWRALEGERALTISHHVAWGGRKVDWNFRSDKFQRVVEIYSQHGAFEFNLNPLGPQSTSTRAPGHFVRDALAMGHKMGILASSDGHFGYPGNGWMWAPTALDSTARATGLTGIYAETLTRESLFSALEERRVYGTTDHRTILAFKVNGEWMGSEIQSDLIPLITGSVLSHTQIKSVEIVKFDGMNYEFIPLNLEGVNTSLEFSYRDSSYLRSSFYYLRVTSIGNSNDRFAWSSPVWVNKPILSNIVELPTTNEYGYFSESDIAYRYEIGFSFRSESLPFSVSDNLSFEAYNVQESNTVSVFVNDIFLSYVGTNEEMVWGTIQSVNIPKYLVDSVNVIRFENNKALLNNEMPEWGVRNLRMSSSIIAISPGESSVIKSHELKQNFPNPFNPITTIEYTLQSRSEISLIVFNIIGQEVARLVDNEKAAGKHFVKWDASNLASGIYFYRLQADNFVLTKKMVLLK